MKFSQKLLCGSLLTLATVGLPQAAHAVTTTATVKAAVLKPITLTGGGTIDLGTILTPSTATFSGTFTVLAAATQTGTFCASGFSCSGTPAAAMFNIQGTKSNNIGLNIPLTVTLSLTGYTGGGATPTITLNTVNSVSANNATGAYTIQLPNSGTPGLDFYIGGALTLTQATSSGNYSGTVTVTADYN
ncbi:MAG: DUF4402 domain-containing protein [Sphingomicrobium sp.]